MLAKSGEVNHTGWGCCQQPFQFTPVILLISAWRFFFFSSSAKTAFPTKGFLHLFSRNPVASAERCVHPYRLLKASHTWSIWLNNCPSLFSIVLFFCTVSFKWRSETRLIRWVWVSDLTSQCQPVAEACAQTINKNEKHLQRGNRIL